MGFFQKIKKQDFYFFLFIFFLILPSFFISSKAVIRSFYPLLIFSALINNRRAFVTCSFPFLFFVPGAIYFWYHYHSPLNITFWLILFGSNLHEALDYLSSLKIEIISLFIGMFFFYLQTFKKTWGPIYVNRKLRASMALLILVPFLNTGESLVQQDYFADLSHHFADSYPWNMVIGYSAAKIEIKKFQNASVNVNWILNTKQEKRLQDQEQIFVLVIGESARRDRHQLYGYQKNTTPEMMRLKNDGELLAFNDLITLHPHTMDSVPTIMTKQNGIDQSHRLAPSFVDIFKDAGFKTYWLSNQAAMGKDENKISSYAQHSDYFHSLHVHSISLPWAYDGELLPEFEEKLQESSRKKLIILHLQGSHYGFDRRYPKEFNIFEDHYDNTILYTDYLLGKIVEDLKKSGKIAGLMYVSDHGLMLGECGQYTHFDMKQSYEVPFWVWFSDDWRHENNKKYFAALKNLNKKISTMYVLDSLVDMAGLKYQGYEDKKSVLSSSMQETFPRLVKTYSRIIDYDHSENDINCHLTENHQIGKL